MRGAECVGDRVFRTSHFALNQLFGVVFEVTAHIFRWAEGIFFGYRAERGGLTRRIE